MPMRFQLSTILSLVTILAIGLGWWLDNQQKQIQINSLHARHADRLNEIENEHRANLKSAILASEIRSRIQELCYLDVQFRANKEWPRTRKTIALQHVYRLWQQRNAVDEFSQSDYYDSPFTVNAQLLARELLDMADCHSWESYLQSCLDYEKLIDHVGAEFPALRDEASSDYQKLCQFITDSCDD